MSDRGNWLTSPGGIPYLGDAQSAILCRQDGHFSYGTHTVFIGRIVEETEVAARPAIVPTITGRAWITGTAQFVLADDDPFPSGFLV